MCKTPKNFKTMILSRICVVVNDNILKFAFDLQHAVELWPVNVYRTVVKPWCYVIISAHVLLEGTSKMKVYLVRHGDAVSSDVDPQRPLSEQGLADIRKIASFIRPLEISVGHIWHSGKSRAAQTAEILAEAVEVQKDCSSREGLRPNDDVSAIADELEAYDTNLMIVGHLPFMGNLTSLLAAGRETANVVAFDAGAIASLKRRNPGKWQINWMVTPEILA
jgi:phosphohistidine phosphatase